MTFSRLLRLTLLTATGLSAAYQIGAMLATRRFFGRAGRMRGCRPSGTVLEDRSSPPTVKNRPSPPAPLPILGEGSLEGQAASLPLAQNWERGPGGEGRYPTVGGEGRFLSIGDEGLAWPPVSLLKPVKGADVEAAANFRSFCRQDYLEYEVLFGALDPADPALAVARVVASEAGSAPTRVFSCARTHGANRKVSNLLNLMPHARHDLIVITDSDMRVTPDYLRTVVAPFRDPRVGLVTCPYRATRVVGPAARLEALAIATEFIPSVMVAERLGGMRFAFGSTLALRRRALEAIGGLEALADHLADDYELGRRVRAAGWEVVLAPYVVETVLGRERPAAMWQRRLRWARTVRVCRPAGYRGSFVTHTTALALLALAAAATSRERFIAAAALAARGVAAWGAARALGARLDGADLLLLPVSDLVSAALWMGGLGGRTVTWRGERYRLQPDGRLEAISAPDSADQKVRTEGAVERPND